MTHEYKLSKNDLDEIKYNSKDGDVKLSSLTEETLIILSKMVQGLHHLPFGDLGKLLIQDSFFIEYYYQGSLATTDYDALTILVIMAHELSVRVEIQRTKKNGIKLLFHERSNAPRSNLQHHPTIEESIKYLRNK